MKNLESNVLWLLLALSPASALAQAPEAGAPAASPGTTRPAVTPFVGVGWRGLALAGHLSHGPDLEAGVALLGGHLKLGLAGFARPGPINPATFTVQAAGGREYKGSSTLNLRSDGAIFGLMVAPVVTVPGVESLSLELPVLLGQGAFGFYLAGEDRDTPDGRRVSAWENELMEGRDSSFGLGLDVGLRLAWKPTSTSSVRPYLGVHYSTVLGYDAYVRSSYDGFSLALGLQFDPF